MPAESIQEVDPTSDTLVCGLSKDLPPTWQTKVLLFAKSASRIDADKIGWMPAMAYDNRHDRGEILALFNNADLVGFVMMSRPSPYQELRCLQIWVRQDARMILHGRALIEELNRVADSRRCITLRLWCAEDLAANLFWETIGFKKKGWRWGPAKKPRRHLLWMKAVEPTQQLLSHEKGGRPESALHVPAIQFPTHDSIMAAVVEGGTLTEEAAGHHPTQAESVRHHQAAAHIATSFVHSFGSW